MTENVPGTAYVRDVSAAVPNDFISSTALAIERHVDVKPMTQRIWQLLATPQTAESLCRVLVREYGIERETCAREMHALLDDLFRRALIQVSPDA